MSSASRRSRLGLLRYRSAGYHRPEYGARTDEEEHALEDDVKVLLIEDDVDAAEMYRLRLAADGYTVVTANDGREGLRMAAD